MKLLLEKFPIVEEVVHILEILYEATKLLQKPEFGLSDFFACWIVIGARLKVFTSHIACKTDLAQCLQKELDTRKQILLDNDSMAAAIFLDRRFSSELTQAQRENAKSAMMKVWKRIQEVHQSPLTTANDENSQKKETYIDVLEKYFNEKGVMSINESGQSGEIDYTKGEIGMEDIFNRFDLEFQSRLPPNTNIMAFWEETKQKYPELYLIASVINAIPPTQCIIESNFSLLSFVFNSKRCTLDQTTLEDIMLIKLNPTLFYEVCAAEMSALN